MLVLADTDEEVIMYFPADMNFQYLFFPPILAIFFR